MPHPPCSEGTRHLFSTTPFSYTPYQPPYLSPHITSNGIRVFLFVGLLRNWYTEPNKYKSANQEYISQASLEAFL